jgi:putative restriction endonuclease
VVDAYHHTCAFCRIRVIAPDGRTAVAASHIVPWSHSHNDDPRNGMALCGLHHWSFDRGLLGVEGNYQITVSPVVDQEHNVAEALLKLDHEPIYLPAAPLLWPARSALRWHIENIFWREAPPRLL